MAIQQLVYISAAGRIMSSLELAALLVHARSRNAALGVAGILIHHSGSFLQVLEGPESAVEPLFRKIEADPRHRRIVVLGRQAVTQGTYTDWSMGFVDGSSAVVAALPGFKDLSRGSFHAEPSPAVRSRAFYLLESFSVGRLRQFVAA